MAQSGKEFKALGVGVCRRGGAIGPARFGPARLGKPALGSTADVTHDRHAAKRVGPGRYLPLALPRRLVLPGTWPSACAVNLSRSASVSAKWAASV